MQLQLQFQPAGKLIAALVALAFASATLPARGAQLTLEEAVRRALAANRAVTASALALQGEELGLATARSDFDFKVVPSGAIGRIGSNALTETGGFNGSIGVQMTRRFETGTSVSLGPSFNRFGSDRNTTLAFSLEQPILRAWDRDVHLAEVRRAEFSLEAARLSMEHARIEVMLETIAAYFGVVRETELVAFGNSQQQRLERHVLVAEAKERSGIVGPMDLYRARIRLKDAEDAHNQARLVQATAMNRLRRAMEAPLDMALALATGTPAPPADDPRHDEISLERRRDVAQARAELDEAQRLAALAAKRVLPDVTLRVAAGQATQVDPLLVQFVPATQRQWSLALQASSDLQRVAERNAARQAQLRVEMARAGLAARIDDARRQVREQRAQVADARARIGLREEQMRDAEARLALAQVKFLHDMASNQDVVEAENELQRAQASLHGARAEHAIGAYQLLAMTGRLTESFP